ncbi:hypothetical protein [Actinoplanes sp. RD1]|uniref:hypothetical protein n=1 Tax=Actinoplanes sp. RD1 TaxID=3064538 RepID=UPI0027428CDC|nr:hypothetical protein [Actinoplanes sp. RD1]
MTGTGFTAYRHLVTPRPAEPTYEVDLNADPDTLILSEAFARPGGSYVTGLAPDALPDPPLDANSCVGRHDWAHGEPVNGVDADSTLALLSLTAHDHPVRVTGAEVHVDKASSQPLAGTLITCPGRGGNEPPHVIDVDLDSLQVFFLEAEAKPPTTMNVRIAPHTTETFLISAHLSRSWLRWRLELTIDDKTDHKLTIGPEGHSIGSGADHPSQKPFETTAGIGSVRVEFRNGKWEELP